MAYVMTTNGIRGNDINNEMTNDNNNKRIK